MTRSKHFLRHFRLAIMVLVFSIIACRFRSTPEETAIDSAPVTPILVSSQASPMQEDAKKGFVTEIDFSDDCNIVAVGSHTGGVYVYRTADYGLDWERQFQAWITALALDPKGQMLAVGLQKNSENLIILDAQSGETKGTLNRHTSSIAVLDWSPDGMYLATGGSREYRAIVWDLTTFEPIKSIELIDAEYQYISNDVTWSPDGQQIAIATITGRVLLLDVDSDEITKVIDTFTPDIYGLVEFRAEIVVWSPPGDQILVKGGFFDAGIWDVASGERVDVPRSDQEQLVFQVVWLPDGQPMAVTIEPDEFLIWNISTHQIEFTLPEVIPKIALGENKTALCFEKQLFASTSADGSVQISSLKTGELLGAIEGFQAEGTWNN